MPTHDRAQVPYVPESFDLTGQAWIPVLLSEGRESELSLCEVFEQATRIRRLACELPTQEFALTRLLLAIAHDALDGPGDIEEWADLWEDPQALRPVLPYLEEHRDRFDLLHPHAPFYQCAGLRTGKDEVFSLNRIVADVPNGNPFFTARFPGVERITFAEAARWVVHAQAYDTSGIKTGVEGDPRAKAGKAYPQGPAWAGNLGAVLAEGTNLRETLLLNLIAADHWSTVHGDLPVWRRPPAGPGAADELASRPTGPRDLYTWQSRRIRLHADHDGVHGVVLTYGDPLTPQNRFDTEPMTGWRRSQAQEKKLGRPLVYMPREVDPTRAAWRGLGSLIASAAPLQGPAADPAPELRPGLVHWLARLEGDEILPKGRRMRLRTFGAVYGTQQSVIDEITGDAVAFALVVLSERDPRLGETAKTAVEDADSAVRALGDLASDLAKAAGSESETPKASARDAGFGALDGPYRLWLTAIRDSDDPTALRTDWQQQTRRIVSGLADDLIAQAGDTAWEGRIVTTKKGEAWLNTSSADLWFRGRLKRALPLAFPAAQQPEPLHSSPVPTSAGPSQAPDSVDTGTAPDFEEATA
ncbi:type I-E CRISPR-associated protein Cse1/CasA [Kitasatospora sp. YST-16]|uniref:type I-E CRISPR-associated protein Cse1/CasA n=1 Tax=Kitasatospora sp. YST-16 TaxID=2998080 RepID=UPI002284DDE4|nr:type I-E CRISPR-associated protein Cse1/CasA [Kitasatospora sp. YST-16]WAL70487.1 type I-E CRISPR-associated protein Cse1/CasA [Kitasatospora sp. YST-16]WNW36526.1 type I-E CRISPR-associated protein Cse1/CasA [Streptomyces sp. Li-HN-5-13]